MNLGLDAVGGEVLVVSQFTLYGNCRKGRRPSFTDAANRNWGSGCTSSSSPTAPVWGIPLSTALRRGYEGGVRQRRPRDPDSGHGAADGHPQKKIGDRMTEHSHADPWGLRNQLLYRPRQCVGDLLCHRPRLHPGKGAERGERAGDDRGSDSPDPRAL